MKRDIFFTELTPLNFKSSQSSPPPFLAIITIFELLIGASSTILLPSLEDSCHESPLFTWLSVMLVGLNVHLIMSALESLWEKLGKPQGLWVIHGIILTGIAIWLGLGHYWTFFTGLGCFEEQSFVVCCGLIGIMDLLSVGIAALAMNYYIYTKHTE